MQEFEIEWANYYAREYGVPPELVIAIIHVQSRWQPYAVSEKGAAGLMQLLPATAYRFGVTNRFVVQETFVAESPIWPISCISLAEICGW
jgi:soluble lytic murein transglycosylase-like protein